MNNDMHAGECPPNCLMQVVGVTLAYIIVFDDVDLS